MATPSYISAATDSIVKARSLEKANRLGDALPVNLNIKHHAPLFKMACKQYLDDVF